MSTIYEKLQISLNSQENPNAYIGPSMLEAQLESHTTLLNELSLELGLWEEEEEKIRAEKMKVAAKFAAIERLIASTTTAICSMRGEVPPAPVEVYTPARKYFKKDNGEVEVRVARSSNASNRQIRLQNLLNAFDSVQEGGIARQSSIAKAYLQAGHVKNMMSANNHLLAMADVVLDPADSPPGFLRATFWKRKETAVCA